MKNLKRYSALNKRFGLKYTIDPGVFSTIFQWFTNYCQSVSALQNVYYQILRAMRVIIMLFNFGKNWVNQMRFSFYRRLVLLPVCILMDSLDSPLNLVNNVLFCLTVWFDFVKQHRDWHVCVTSWYMRVVTSLYNADML